MLYFRGCSARIKLNEIADSTEKLLRLFNIKFDLLDNEKCCGSVLLRTGLENESKELIKENISTFKGKTILVSCAGCYNTLKHDYKRLFNLDIEVIHVSQFFNNLLNEILFESKINNKLNCNEFSFNNKSNINYNINSNINSNINFYIDPNFFSILSSNLKESKLEIFKKDNSNKLDIFKYNPDFKTVTYHDPCHLGRHSGIYDAPRELIKKFANIKEMASNKENALCCGAGGGVKSGYDDLSNKMASNRIKEAEDTGVDTIVTGCPFCKLNLKENSNLNVLDLSEFVYRNITQFYDDFLIKQEYNNKNNIK
ncbi:(Fe-S)-binding protein [Methanobrevibacter curvatus]|uniref:Lactate utilization protein A n=1 Tax=Methanobrevibacter curvatus TaxID=49547 RepID=A0A166D613_9EURY|nr:heterodisulfide reductase-related iron-sulfur binding cluster [Methanobrevibacter curvatus]KZX15243.1 lactate utilization protein A [Methanobrevibacter curvatus]